jgi:hypothetical protein
MTFPARAERTFGWPYEVSLDSRAMATRINSQVPHQRDNEWRDGDRQQGRSAFPELVAAQK